MIYLDNAATTWVYPVVETEMKPYIGTLYGNAGSIYDLGIKSKNAINKAREQVAALINCDDPNCIIFTSGGTEANNMVIFGLKEHLKSVGRKKIITSAIEHDSVLNSVKALAQNEDFIHEKIYPNREYNTISPDSLSQVIDKNTGLVSVMSMNNEIGSINNVAELCNISHSKGSLFHTDCVQGITCLDIDVTKDSYDFVSISAHKIHAPKGVGALYIRDKSIIKPLIYGGNAQEFGLRGGTENVAGIVGFGCACEWLKSNRKDINKRISETSKYFVQILTRQAEVENISLKFLNQDNGINRILSIFVPGIDTQTLIIMLNSQGICVSAGSACNNSITNPSHVLTSIGLTPEEARSVFRVSFSRENNIYEAEIAAKEIIKCIKLLKSI